MSGRYQRNDIFWFTFFHEAGHILLHGKKGIFLEKVYYSDLDRKKEYEADEFASKWLLSAEEEAEIMTMVPLNAKVIRKFAKKINSHPAIIIGRLHHKKILPYTMGRVLLEPIVFN